MPTSQAAVPDTGKEFKIAIVQLVKIRLASVNRCHLNEFLKSLLTPSIPSVNFSGHAMKHILT